MLSRIIVSSFKQCIEIALWLSFLGSFILGWKISKLLFGSVSISGMFFGIVVWFAIAVGFFGALLVLEDLRERVKNIEASKSSDPAP